MVETETAVVHQADKRMITDKSIQGGNAEAPSAEVGSAPETGSDGATTGSVQAIGRQVGHFRVLGLLGRGGMGVVYRGRDLILDREIALKTILPEYRLNSRRRQRLMREARMASKLSHPSIVPIFEVFESEGNPWIAMQLVEGPTLASHLMVHGPPTIGRILEHQTALAGALSTAHSSGVLHRDIKPSNILIGPDGTVLLTDFGLARSLECDSQGDTPDSTETLTEDGSIVGTLPYMSPEQAFGRPVDERSDIFSLGAVFYEMITGNRAFEASSDGGLIEAICHRQPSRPTHSTDEVPVELQEIVARCLEKEPADRYQNAGDLASDLKNLSRRSGSWDSSPARHPGNWTQYRKQVLLFCSVIAVAGLILIGQQWAGRRLNRIPPHVARQLTDQAELEADPAVSPTGREIVYSLARAGNTDIWMIDRLGGSPLQLTTHAANDRCPRWYPDGSAVVFVSDRSGQDGIWRIPRLGGPAELVLENAQDPVISPDGRRLAFARAGPNGFHRIGVANLDNLGDVQMVTGPKDGLWDHGRPAWSPDGSVLCYHDFRNLWLVDAAHGQARPLTDDDPPDREPAWAPNGRHIYFTSFRDGARAIWRQAVKGGVPERVTTGSGSERAPHLSSDGSSLVYATQQEIVSLEIVDRASKQRSRLHVARDMSQPALAPDGSSVVFYSTRENGLDLWRIALEDGRTSGDPVRITRLPGTSSNPRFSPDGRWIVFYRVSEGQRDLWVVPSGGGAPHQLTDDPSIDILPEWSPDGREIAFSSDRSGSLQLWVVGFEGGATVGLPRQVTDLVGSAIRPAWSPDGREVAFILNSADSSEVWIISADGVSPPQQVTQGADVQFHRWARRSGELFVSGYWGEAHPTIRLVSPETHETVPLVGLTPTNPDAELSIFDVSPDGRIVIMKSTELRGDIWELDAESQTF